MMAQIAKYAPAGLILSKYKQHEGMTYLDHPFVF